MQIYAESWKGISNWSICIEIPLDKRELEAILSNYVWILKWFYLCSASGYPQKTEAISYINFALIEAHFLEHPFVLDDVRPPVCKDTDAITG